MFSMLFWRVTACLQGSVITDVALRFIQTTHLRLVVALVEYVAVDIEMVVVVHHMVRLRLAAMPQGI